MTAYGSPPECNHLFWSHCGHFRIQIRPQLLLCYVANRQTNKLRRKHDLLGGGNKCPVSEREKQTSSISQTSALYLRLEEILFYLSDPKGFMGCGEPHIGLKLEGKDDLRNDQSCFTKIHFVNLDKHLNL